MQEKIRKICLIRNKEDWDSALPYIAMGYKMSKHAFLFHFSPYFLLFGRHPIPPSSITIQMYQVVELDFPASWVVASLALGLRPKQRGCKVASQEGDPIVTSYALQSAKSVRA
jgi:hypothetical protein